MTRAMHPLNMAQSGNEIRAIASQTRHNSHFGCFFYLWDFRVHAVFGGISVVVALLTKTENDDRHSYSEKPKIDHSYSESFGS